MNRYFVIPRAELQPYVDRLWGWESELAQPMPPMLPGTGAELMFHYGDRVFLRSARHGVIDPGEAFLPGTRHGPCELLAQGRIGFISVRFRSGALRHFSPLSLIELANRPATAGEVWGDAGRQLAERIIQAPDRNKRVALLEDWLLACLARHGKQQPAIEAAIRALYYRHREVKIDALADEIGMSRRNFERVFREQIGLTPKAFQRTARFHLTLRNTLLAGRSDYLDAALAHGYYDQAHFIHEFKGFVGKSPTLFLQAAASMAHFYNPSIFSPDKVPFPR
ncbi:hypothetical protein GCM10027046_11800 [Uliginosibacterium flavum]|uniref:AraC family transcriptional regulator n=1 Tax=Uliginosibacterium flavum TaxID=1396831 RepID=A0ABV2TQG8_9RHOO